MGQIGTKILNSFKNMKAAYQQQLLLSSDITLKYIVMYKFFVKNIDNKYQLIKNAEIT